MNEVIKEDLEQVSGGISDPIGGGSPQPLPPICELPHPYPFPWPYPGPTNPIPQDPHPPIVQF